MSDESLRALTEALVALERHIPKLLEEWERRNRAIEQSNELESTRRQQAREEVEKLFSASDPRHKEWEARMQRYDESQKQWEEEDPRRAAWRGWKATPWTFKIVWFGFMLCLFLGAAYLAAATIKLLLAQ